MISTSAHLQLSEFEGLYRGDELEMLSAATIREGARASVARDAIKLLSLHKWTRGP